MVALSDRRDDWMPMLVTLKQCFNQYPRFTNCCDGLKGTKITGRNSSSYDGNFLEAINLAMNGKSNCTSLVHVSQSIDYFLRARSFGTIPE